MEWLLHEGQKVDDVKNRTEKSSHKLQPIEFSDKGFILKFYVIMIYVLPVHLILSMTFSRSNREYNWENVQDKGRHKQLFNLGAKLNI